MRRALTTLFVSAALLGGSAEARADEPRPLDVNPWVSGTVTTLGAVGWIGSELGKASLVPTQCRWCDRTPDGRDTVPGIDESVRNGLKWNDIKTPATMSDVIGFAGLPVLMFGGLALTSGHESAWRDIPEDFLVTTEAVMLAADLNQLVKFSVARERPFVHALPDAQKATTAAPADNDLSFYSGHTTLAFSLATSAATVATLRGYRWAPVLWAVGLPVAAFVGYLRIAADKHYFTDVMTGALLGSAFGVAIPLLHRAQVHAGSVTAEVVPMGNGLALAGSF